MNAFFLLLSALFSFVQLNCENLFDCEHDSLKNDYEFLPDAHRHWNKHKYWDKLNGIARAILACGENEGEWILPDLVALCEVENDSVLHDLTKRSLLKKAGYEYVMTESDDERGIDVALLFSPFTFRLLTHHAVRIPQVARRHPTRDLLYVKGLIQGGDTLHLVIVHAPSRASGVAATAQYRLKVAEQVGATVDSVRTHNSDARIIVAGDFNDYAGDESLEYLARHALTDVSSGAMGTNGAKGTYKYKGKWGSLDHILTSSSMVRRLDGCRIVDAPFLLEKDDVYGGVQPKRTYQGHRYHGGVSDHLPLLATFKRE